MAWEQIFKILPFTHERVSASPFIMPNSYSYDEEKDFNGESISDWFTGSGCVLIKTLIRGVFGVNQTLDEIVIAPANCKAAVAGSGIASGYTEWDGKIVIEQQISVLELQEASMTMKGLSGDVGFTFRTDMRNAIWESVGRYALANTVTLLGLADDTETIEEDVES